MVPISPRDTERKPSLQVLYMKLNEALVSSMSSKIFFWLRWVFVVAASRGYSSLWCTGFSLQWLLLLQSTSSRARGLQ